MPGPAWVEFPETSAVQRTGWFKSVDGQLFEACKKSPYLESMKENPMRVANPFTQCEMETHDHVGLAFRGWAGSSGVGTCMHNAGLPALLTKSAA